MNKTIEVEVAYAPSGDQQFLETLQVAEGASIEQVLLAAKCIKAQGVAFQDESQYRVGIWNKLSTLSAQVRAGDRVAVFRPLDANAQKAWRERIAQERKQKKA